MLANECYFHLWKNDRRMLHKWIAGNQRNIFGYFIKMFIMLIVKLFLIPTPYYVFGYTKAPQKPTDYILFHLEII